MSATSYNIRGLSVTALPASPLVDTIYRLTATDNTARAAPGEYVDNGDGWVCNNYRSMYYYGNLTGSVSLSLIPGAAYFGTVIAGAITPFVTTLTAKGIAGLQLMNASLFAVAQPSMAGRTPKALTDLAPLATALVQINIEDNGMYLYTSCAEAV